MAVPGFDDPALASLPPAGNLYFTQDTAVASRDPGEPGPGHYATQGGTRSPATDLQTSPLMFGQEKFTSQGEAVVHASDQITGRGHWSEITNFHGSPAPWVLIGILLVAGLLMFSAKGEARVGIRL